MFIKNLEDKALTLMAFCMLVVFIGAWSTLDRANRIDTVADDIFGENNNKYNQVMIQVASNSILTEMPEQHKFLFSTVADFYSMNASELLLRIWKLNMLTISTALTFAVMMAIFLYENSVFSMSI